MLRLREGIGVVRVYELHEIRDVRATRRCHTEYFQELGRLRHLRTVYATMCGAHGLFLLVYESHGGLVRTQHFKLLVGSDDR